MTAIAIAPGKVIDTQGTGVVTASNLTVKSGGQSILVADDLVSPHGTHLGTIRLTAATCSKTVKIGGKGIALATTKATCGGPTATMLALSPTVNAT
jgi:uncharacterized Zn-binding protein involved in type VI secretion